MSIAKHKMPFMGFSWQNLVVCLLLLCSFTIMAPSASWADDPTPPSRIKDGTCTNEKDKDGKEIFGIEEPASGDGLIATIIEEVKKPLVNVSRTVFQAITGDAGFKNSVRIISSIYVIIYGILFTFGMVQITIHDLLVRLVKLAVMNMLLSTNAWQYFDQVVVKFFNGSVDSIINQVSTIAFDTDTDVGQMLLGQSPFDPLDRALVYVVSSKMAVTLLAIFGTGPYGFVIGLILVMSLGSFLKALFNALWIYIMALVIRTIMFGMAPLFMVCILFARTRHLFDGWLNQLVNAMLQPIFLFTFFAFFVLLIKACLEQVLEIPVCWMPTGVHSGTPGTTHFWRFALMECNGAEPVRNAAGVIQYVPFKGLWGFGGAEGINATTLATCNKRIHPIGIMLPLMLWILADLAGRFNHIVIEIAKDLANAATDLSMGSDGIKKWFNEITHNGSFGVGEGGAAPGGAGTTGTRPGAPGSLAAPTKLSDIGKFISGNAPLGTTRTTVGNAPPSPSSGPPQLFPKK